MKPGSLAPVVPILVLVYSPVRSGMHVPLRPVRYAVKSLYRLKSRRVCRYPVTTGAWQRLTKQSVVDANNRFARDMYFRLAGDSRYAGGNLFFSPFSLSSGLAITYEGARGTTADRSVRSFTSRPITSR